MKRGVVRELQLDSAPRMKELHIEILVIYGHQPPTSIAIVERPAAASAAHLLKRESALLLKRESALDRVVGEAEEASGLFCFLVDRRSEIGILPWHWTGASLILIFDGIRKHHQPWQLRACS